MCVSIAAIAAVAGMGRKRCAEQREITRYPHDSHRRVGGGNPCRKAPFRRGRRLSAASILSLPLPELSKKLQDGSLPPEHVFYAYVGKLATETNCITEYLQESENQVRKAKLMEKKGLLYGVPVSIKDSIDCQVPPGHDSTLGFIKNLNKPAAEDSVVVQVLKRQGAIPFVKTNVPQSLISYDCKNLIFGQTRNPLLFTRTPGGSSGGEGALVGGGGSILGIGTDVGGSLRFPAAFCGICAIKPTGKRLRYCEESVGPLAKDVESLALCLRALLSEDMFSLDSTVPPLPFNEEVYSSTKPLRIGYYETDFFTMPSPAMRRAVRQTKELLEEAGHTVGALGGCFASWEEYCPGSKALLDFSKIRPDVACWLLPEKSQEPSCTPKESLSQQLWDSTSTPLTTSTFPPQDFCHQFIAQWKKLNLDVMLCPMLGPLPLSPPVAVSYTMLYNALDFPAGVVPVTLVTDEDEEQLKGYKGYYRDWWDRTLAKVSSVGMPVAVQCVALPWQEELCLRFMKEVETLSLKKNSFF
uniref:Fatty-acid amide hydrolase 1 n=1 Tax=Zosterops lateralis melanops TaxID=1220523 RepID=A0A8D2P2G4_ZOSLA